MADLDIAWLVNELESLGLKLTTMRRVDGSLALNRWRSMEYWDNAPQVEALWSEHVADNEDVIAAIAAFVSRPEPEMAAVPASPPSRRFASWSF